MKQIFKLAFIAFICLLVHGCAFDKLRFTVDHGSLYHDSVTPPVLPMQVL